MDSPAPVPLVYHGLALLLAATLTGCACGNYGTLVSRRTVVRGAEIVDVFACGVLLRPIGSDTGLSFGYRHASYIYPVATEEEAIATTQWHLFHAPLSSSPPLLRASTTLGIEAQLTPEIKRCTVGYLDQVLTVGGSPNESRIVKLHYPRSRPEETTLAYQAE